MFLISQLFIYPIKSLGGIAIKEAIVTDRGLQWDRRWMLVDEQHQFLTQRQMPQLCFFHTSLTKTGILVSHTQLKQQIEVPYQPATKQMLQVKVWDDWVQAVVVSKQINEWFSDILNRPCKLVYMPEEGHRKVDPAYAPDAALTSFSDGYQILLIGQSSLDDLNSRLEIPVPITNFRPNIVCSGMPAFAEDHLRKFQINHIVFAGVKPCARCVVTTINQQTAQSHKEPLKTLATYRQKNNKILFGQNVLPLGIGSIAIGQSIELLHS